MPIQTGAKGATIAGVSYPPYQYIDWLSPNQESQAVQGGDAFYVPKRGLTPSEELALSASTPASFGSSFKRALDAGFGAVSFARASANGAVVDCYGSMQFCLSGEARFWGARRVCNVIDDTEGLSTGWTLGSTPASTKTLLPIKSPNHSRPSVWRIDRPSGNSDNLILNSRSYRPGKWCLSVLLVGDGVTQVTLRIERSSDSAGTSQVVTPPVGVLTRYAVLHDIVDTSNHRAKITVTTSGASSFVMGDPQMEWVHGQTNPAPSDYVPRGVSTVLLPTGAYASEAGVDGVRYYDYLNPWSLSSGVATRSDLLTPIAPSVLRGIAVAGAATINRLYSSGNLSAAEWTKTSTVNATAADSTLLGKASLWKIEQAAATQGHRVSQVWRGTSPAVNVPIHVAFYSKAADAACPFVYAAIRQLDGVSFKYAWFNVVTGQMGAVSSGAEGWMYREGDLWCCNLVLQSGASGSTAPVLWLGVTQTNSQDSVAGTLGNGSYFGAIQMDQGLPTSYIGDTSSAATLTRAEEVLSLVSTAMPSQGWTVAADFTLRFPSASALKQSWIYLLYTYVSAADRGGFGLRPAAFGGFYDGGEDEVFFDWYPGISADNLAWDGVHIKSGHSAGVFLANPMDTHRYQWSAAAVAVQPSGSNQSGSAGAIAATSAGNDQPRPAINAWPTNPRTWYVGRNSESVAQRAEVFVRNLSWSPTAKGGVDMVATS